MNGAKATPVPLTCNPGSAPLCVVRPETPTVCTPLPPCPVEVPVNSDVMLALAVLCVIVIALATLRRKP